MRSYEEFSQKEAMALLALIYIQKVTNENMLDVAKNYMRFLKLAQITVPRLKYMISKQKTSDAKKAMGTTFGYE